MRVCAVLIRVTVEIYPHTHGVESEKRAGHKGHALLKTATELRLHLNCRRCDKPIVPFEFTAPDKVSNTTAVALTAHSTPTTPSVYLQHYPPTSNCYFQYLSDRSSNPFVKHRSNGYTSPLHTAS